MCNVAFVATVRACGESPPLNVGYKVLCCTLHPAYVKSLPNQSEATLGRFGKRHTKKDTEVVSPTGRDDRVPIFACAPASKAGRGKKKVVSKRSIVMTRTSTHVLHTQHKQILRNSRKEKGVKKVNSALTLPSCVPRSWF